MIYIDTTKLAERFVQSRKLQADFCRDVGISKEALSRLLHCGGPVKISTATKVCNALRTAVSSLLDQKRQNLRYGKRPASSGT